MLPQDIEVSTNPNIQMQPDGSADVTLQGVRNPQAVMMPPAESINLAEKIKLFTESTFPSYYNEETLLTGEQALKEMGRVVVEEYEADDTSRTEWKDNVAAQVKLFTGFMGTKTWPWDKCSNVNLPLLTTAVLQFHARAYEALFPPKNVVQTVNTGDEDIDRAMRVAKYMNYQLYYEDESYEDGMDISLLQLPIYGSAFRKTYYDEERKLVTTDYVSADDFVVNYGTRDLESCQRSTHILRRTRNDIRKRAKIGFYLFNEAWKLGEPSPAEVTQGEIKQATDEAVGVSPSSTNLLGLPRIILEQHRLWDINSDGIAEPVTITVDKESETVLRITDRSYQETPDTDPQTITYFTHYTFFPNPDGFYGLGFGTLIRGLNESANTIVNEVIDAGSLANLQGGFVAKRSGIKKGNLKFKMGEFQEVDTFIDDLNKAIYSFNFKGPNQTLYAVLGLLYEYSKLVSSISETMTGQLPASDTPAHTVLALIEEGRKVFSSIHKRIYRSFKKELRKIYRLNSVYLDDTKYFKVLGDRNVPVGPQLQTGRADFIGFLDVIPVADPNISSKAEKVMAAKQVLDDTLSNPLTANNQNSIYEATKRYYEAAAVPEIDKLLAPPPAPLDLSPEEENSNIIMEKPATALPQQDHLHHLDIHEDLITGVYATTLSPAAKNLIEQHKREHLAGHYMQQKSKQIQPPQGGNSEVGTFV